MRPRARLSPRRARLLPPAAQDKPQRAGLPTAHCVYRKQPAAGETRSRREHKTFKTCCSSREVQPKAPSLALAVARERGQGLAGQGEDAAAPEPPKRQRPVRCSQAASPARHGRRAAERALSQPPAAPQPLAAASPRPRPQHTAGGLGFWRGLLELQPRTPQRPRRAPGRSRLGAGILPPPAPGELPASSLRGAGAARNHTSGFSSAKTHPPFGLVSPSLRQDAAAGASGKFSANPGGKGRLSLSAANHPPADQGHAKPSWV